MKNRQIWTAFVTQDYYTKPRSKNKAVHICQDFLSLQRLEKKKTVLCANLYRCCQLSIPIFGDLVLRWHFINFVIMAKRFNNLEDVYNTLEAADFNWDSFAATNKFRKYKEWKQDPDQRRLPAGSSQNTGTRVLVVIRPFGLDYADDAKVKVGMSGRVNTAISGLGTAAIYRHQVDAIATVKSSPGFIPAKAHLALRLASSTTVLGTSNRITGREYKKRVGESYVVPFGAGAATDREFDVQDVILSNRNATHTVTFTPERLMRR